MKDFVNNATVANTKNMPKQMVYKDVVVVGNGPSGISLSYMLAGNWPYWLPNEIDKHPDELLRARLNYADDDKSLIEQNLFELADGLEGRSTNPVSLLLDSLQNPCADLGMDLPGMLEYRYQPEKEIDHIVLGRGPPGGTWHRMDPNLRTLSLSAWMSLPGLNFNDWDLHAPQPVTTPAPPKLCNSHDNPASAGPQITVSVEINAANQLFYEDKCDKCTELRKKQTGHNNNKAKSNVNNNESELGALCCKCSNKLNNMKNYSSTNAILATTQHVRNQNDGGGGGKEDIVPGRGSPIITHLPRRNLSLSMMRQQSKEVQTRALISRVAEYYESYVQIMGLDKYFMDDAVVTSVVPLKLVCKENMTGKFKEANWVVSGFNRQTNKTFTYACKSLVMANGASDLANRLGVKGEGMSLPWLKYELPHLETALEKLSDNDRRRIKPVLIVGAGLSAADAVTICRSSGIPVIHVYRNRTAGLDKMLPENIYPEYHEVHKMMKDTSNTYSLYTALPEHKISDISTAPSAGHSHRVVVQHLKTGETRELEVSFCAILIGSRPDMRFLSVGQDQQQSEICNLVAVNDSVVQKLNRRLFWLKSLCAKCRHLNLCDRSRKNMAEYKRICGHLIGRKCECRQLNEMPASPGAQELQTARSEDGIGFGEDPTKPIDCKTNPIAVDKYTNRVLHAPPGLFAMGPLVGDNFVRFIPGGALAIVSALHQEHVEIDRGEF